MLVFASVRFAFLSDTCQIPSRVISYHAGRSETYQSKRKRRQRILASLPSEMRKHISLRNVETVAVEQLRIDPDTSVADLLDPSAQAVPEPSPKQIQIDLTDLIQMCFPDMPRISSEALADAQVMDIARTAATGHGHSAFTIHATSAKHVRVPDRA